MSKSNLPVLLLKNLVLLPLEEARIELNNDVTKKIIDISKKYFNDEILIVYPVNTLEQVPDTSDLPRTGVIAKISSRIDLPSGNTRIVLQGIKRVRVLKYSMYQNNKDILSSIYIDFPETVYNEVEEISLFRKLNKELELYISNNPFISNAILNKVKGVNELEKLTDMVTSFIPLSLEKKLSLMQEPSRINRAKKLITEINIELAVLALENKIDQELKQNLDDMQKDLILKEKMKIIKEELGEQDTKTVYLSKARQELNNRHIPDNIRNRLILELNKYESTLETSPELGVIKTYIDTLLSLPFGKVGIDETDLNKVSTSLNKTHYGLTEAKERIIEYVAVSTNKDALRPVICLVGPPGVGKTTFAESIALSLNKKFVKISLGGINDPAELLGHRKTYIGSAPGKIVTSLIKSGVTNPIILLDEVDKMSKDYKGDPVNTLLDILDNKQNKNFTDNYLEEKIDLSNITWILTANDKNEIPLVLQDRLDIINLNSYLNYEKINITKNYLINNSLKRNGLETNLIKFDKKAITKIIDSYTKESGVRELDRLIDRIIRKIITEHKLNNTSITETHVKESDIKKYLGVEKYQVNECNITKPGYAKALAYTPYGGEVLSIEVSSYDGKESFVTSGSLGVTLKESILVSIGYIKSNKTLFNINDSVFNKTIHINFRETSIPKDGPSAGTVITSSILSYLLGKEVPPNVSSTGEMTLLGDILPVGGLREKSCSAIKNGINKIYVSNMNKREVSSLDKEIKDKINFVFVKNYIEIYNDLFKGSEENVRNKKNKRNKKSI